MNSSSEIISSSSKDLPLSETVKDIGYQTVLKATKPAGPKTVLVAEDEPVVLEFIADVLREMGYVVLEAHNGEEALHIFKHAHDLTIDLLLTDIIMPKMGGKELVYHVGHLFPETKIAYCSAYPEQLGTRNGMFDRRFPFLQKPVIKDVLKLKVKEILGEAEEESQETPPVTGNN